jgi:hypothetical protein
MKKHNKNIFHFFKSGLPSSFKAGVLVFSLGLVEQILYTLYLLSVGKYLIGLSTLLMFVYMTLYLLIINYAIKDKKNSIFFLILYALACGAGNYIAMILKLIK